ncbi:MAG: sulfite exporter TauE/SafE family protein [Leptospiraceae bacterium]|nr:sulfite exporter TauE/SafE family protein [Leptospiraceae bacterium]
MNGMEDASLWAAISLAFMQGMGGSLHCVGMCGPFVHLLNGRAPGPVPPSESAEASETSSGNPKGESAVSQRQSDSLAPQASAHRSPSEQIRSGAPTYPATAGRAGQKRWSINLIYNFTRSLSYMSVGFFLGMAGKTINLYVVNSIAAVLGAVLLLYFGLTYLFPSQIPGFHGIRMPGWFNRSIGQLVRGRTNPVENAALMGMVSGLLPCGLLYPAYALAMGTGEPLAGAFTMFVFSLGTYPALLLVGLASSRLWDFLRTKWPGRILGLAMILYAILIVFKRWSNAGQF